MNLQTPVKHEVINGEAEDVAFNIHWQVSMAAALTSA